MPILIPSPLVQETDLILYMEDVEKMRDGGGEEEFPRILIFLKIYDPLARTLQNAGKVYPAR